MVCAKARKALRGNFPRKSLGKSVHFLGNLLGNFPRSLLDTSISQKMCTSSNISQEICTSNISSKEIYEEVYQETDRFPKTFPMKLPAQSADFLGNVTCALPATFPIIIMYFEQTSWSFLRNAQISWENCPSKFALSVQPPPIVQVVFFHLGKYL